MIPVDLRALLEAATMRARLVLASERITETEAAELANDVLELGNPLAHLLDVAEAARDYLDAQTAKRDERHGYLVGDFSLQVEPRKRLRAALSALDEQEPPTACACIGPEPGETMCPCRKRAWEAGKPWDIDRGADEQEPHGTV